MRKFLVMIFLVSATPALAWYDSYGGFTCGYMDPVTSFLDNIFGPPCPPPPVAVIEQPQTVIQQQVIQQQPQIQNNYWFPW